MESSESCVVVGAGLSGSLAAVYLAKRGYKVTVYEKRPDSRSNDIYEGKSINLALSAKGLSALRKVGLEDEIVLTFFFFFFFFFFFVASL